MRAPAAAVQLPVAVRPLWPRPCPLPRPTSPTGRTLGSWTGQTRRWWSQTGGARPGERNKRAPDRPTTAVHLSRMRPALPPGRRVLRPSPARRGETGGARAVSVPLCVCVRGGVPRVQARIVQEREKTRGVCNKKQNPLALRRPAHTHTHTHTHARTHSLSLSHHHHPGGHPSFRPPITCRWRWKTDWQPSAPSLMVMRNPVSPKPSCLATVDATARRWPSKGSWAGVALESWVRPDRCFGMTCGWVGGVEGGGGEATQLL